MAEIRIMKINLNFENLTKFKPEKKIIKKIFNLLLKNNNVYKNSCLKNLKIKTLSIDFVFCDDDFIHKINKEYRGFDKPTDVISFALFCDDEKSVIIDEINLGEIIISVDTAQKQAVENNHCLKKEIYYLISHGILHLLGYDHQTQKEYNFMVEMQNFIIKELNYD